MLRAFKQIVFFYVLSLLLAILVFSCTRVGKLPTIEASCSTTLPTQIKSVETNGYRFYILSDWGFNGHFQQLEVAQAMSVAAETASPKMIISCGDNFQVNGVQSVNDPLWMTNFEQVYTHPGLLVDWYAVWQSRLPGQYPGIDRLFWHQPPLEDACSLLQLRPRDQRQHPCPVCLPRYSRADELLLGTGQRLPRYNEARFGHTNGMVARDFDQRQRRLGFCFWPPSALLGQPQTWRYR